MPLCSHSHVDDAPLCKTIFFTLRSIREFQLSFNSFFPLKSLIVCFPISAARVEAALMSVYSITLMFVPFHAQ